VEKKSRHKESETASERTSAPEVLERLVQQAEHAGTSDIHLQMRAGPASVAFRLYGVHKATIEAGKKGLSVMRNQKQDGSIKRVLMGV
jgi:type II secretory ATPase GspE/PulE/Tfp pilus assembly ATPase PilB-like protein